MAKKAVKPTATQTWRNRIVGQGVQPASQFLANPSNARIHPKAQQAALTGSLNEIGWIQNVIVNRLSGNVVDGHARIAEALKVGDETPVPFVEVELTDAEEKLALATLDPISAMAAYDKAQLDALLREVNTGDAALQTMLAELASSNGLDYGGSGAVVEDIEPQIDRAAELQVKWGTSSGQLWRLGEHRLLCGDSTNAEDVARVMGGDVAELLFTSPPYADMREYKGGDLTVEKLAQFIPTFKPFVIYQVVNLGIKREDGEIVQYWDVYISEAQKCGYKLLSWNVWSRHGYGGSIGAMTAMFPIEHEWVFVFGANTKTNNATVKNKSSGKSFVGTVRGQDGQMGSPRNSAVGALGRLGSVFVSDVARGEKEHPAAFPLEFPNSYIEAMTKAGDCVAEPFSGSGTTIMACEQLGRKCRAIEISPEYVSVALERWSVATKKQPELIP